MDNYKSYKNEVLKALNRSKKEICNEIGNFVVAEAQLRTVVDTGNLRRSETFEVMDNNDGVIIGVTNDAEYAPHVEFGTNKQQAQPFLQPAVLDNISTIEEIAQRNISLNLGGDS